MILVAALLALAGAANAWAEAYDGSGKSRKIRSTERWMSGLSRTPGKRV